MTATNDEKNENDVEAPCAEGGTSAKGAIAEGELNSEHLLERVILFALDEATEQLQQGGGFDPFIVLVQGEELYVEELSGDSEEDFRAAAEQTVFQMAKLCNNYVFCYDGFAELEQGASDALIAEFASQGDENAQVIVKLYRQDGTAYEFDETLYHLGDAESLYGSDL